IIHLDDLQGQADHHYQPEIELVGDIPSTIDILADKLPHLIRSKESASFLKTLKSKPEQPDDQYEFSNDTHLHPLQLIEALQN
ncbi:hypothetical protein L6R34_32085, partial [Escherichia coli]|nr:hypothetical protein [Escherichia coli]